MAFQNDASESRHAGAEFGEHWKNPRAERIRNKWREASQVHDEQEQVVRAKLLKVLHKYQIDSGPFLIYQGETIAFWAAKIFEKIDNSEAQAEIVKVYVEGCLSHPDYDLPDPWFFLNEPVKNLVPEYFEDDFLEGIYQRARTLGNNKAARAFAGRVLMMKPKNYDLWKQHVESALEATVDDALAFETDRSVPANVKYLGDTYRSLLLEPTFWRYTTGEPDEFSKENPSAAAFKIARRVCDFYLEMKTPVSMLKARGIAQETRLDRFDPAFYEGVMAMTKPIEILKLKVRRGAQGLVSAVKSGVGLNN